MSVPVVPLSSFGNLAGSALAADLRALIASGKHDGLVLFSDMRGENLAILPVGPGQPYASIDEVRGIEIEGLRPLCAMRLREESAPAAPSRADSREIARIEESLNVRERYIAECERKLAEVGQNLSEREAMLEQREQMLLAKERDFFRRSGDATRRDETAKRVSG
jgi:hypothetical protein